MDDKELEKAGAVVGNPLANIEAQKSAGLREFHRQCSEYADFGAKEMMRLREINTALIEPFVAYVERLNIADPEICRNLFELRIAMEKPNELREYSRSLKGTRWENISSPPYNDVIDQRKFDNLVRHYRTVLTRFGDVEGRMTSLIARTRERIIMLAENARRDGASSVPISVPPGDGSDKLTVIDNLPHD